MAAFAALLAADPGDQSYDYGSCEASSTVLERACDLATLALHVADDAAQQVRNFLISRCIRRCWLA